MSCGGAGLAWVRPCGAWANRRISGRETGGAACFGSGTRGGGVPTRVSLTKPAAAPRSRPERCGTWEVGRVVFGKAP